MSYVTGEPTKHIPSVSKGYPKISLRDTAIYSQGLAPCARHVLDLQDWDLWISEENLSALWDTKVNNENIFKNNEVSIF